MSYPLKKVILPINQDEWEKIGVIDENFLLTTSLALAAGAVLEYLEKNGPSKMWEMSCELTEWPAILLVMSIGVLVCEHLICARKRHRGIVLELLNGAPSSQKEAPLEKGIKKSFLFFLAALLFISSTVFASEISQDKLKLVSLGMKKDDIVFTLGQPDSIQTEGLNEEGKTVERLEYNVAKPASMPTEGSSTNRGSEGGSRYGAHSAQQHGSSDTYSLVTVNGVLVRIEKQPQKTDNDFNDYRPRTQGGKADSLNL